MPQPNRLAREKDSVHSVDRCQQSFKRFQIASGLTKLSVRWCARECMGLSLVCRYVCGLCGDTLATWPHLTMAQIVLIRCKWYDCPFSCAAAFRCEAVGQHGVWMWIACGSSAHNFGQLVCERACACVERVSVVAYCTVCWHTFGSRWHHSFAPARSRIH